MQTAAFLRAVAGALDLVATPAPPRSSPSLCPTRSSSLVCVPGVALGIRVFKFIKQWKDTLLVRFKIIVAHFQIVTTFPAVLDVQWPEAFNRWVHVFCSIFLCVAARPGRSGGVR